MTGMGGGVSRNDSFVIAAFHTALKHQLLIVFVVAIVLVLAWNFARTIQVRAQARSVTPAASGAEGSIEPPVHVDPVDPPERQRSPEPTARLILRIAFGLIWTLDGLLQLQGAMPLGLPSSVIAPSADGSPSWVVRLVHVGVTIWTNHPVTAAASAVWIQIGIGIVLLVAPRGIWSRSAGVVSAGWGLIVWSFGEAFGGIFGPGASFLFGLPGAALFYVVAGVLLALPDTVWRTAALGRWMLRGLGVFVLGMGVLQAWPGRGAWSGQATPTASPGLLTSMTRQMAQAPQPSTVSSWVRAFAGFDAAHGWAVNLVVVVALGVIGACLVTARPRVALVGLGIGVVFCLADWVLVQDLGFFGGVGTDPNSMVPFSVLLVAAYVAMVRPTRQSAPVVAPVRVAPAPRTRLIAWSPTYLLQVAAATLAAAVIVIGAAPMAIASTNPNADPIVTEALNGTPYLINTNGYPFSLVDEHGRHVTLASFRGSVVVLTFLDPVCTTDCQLIAQELRAADEVLGGPRSGVQFVAVATNPVYDSIGVLDAFDKTQGLTHVTNWWYLTGPTAVLQHVWDDYDVQVLLSPGGAMVDHSDTVYVLDRTGRIRTILGADPGDSSALHSSFTTLLEAEVRKVATL
jgi:cytochrome oxidase Cu insertion factor (SCO1/SenC/PrrC family)